MSFTWFTGFLAIAVGTGFGGCIAWLFKEHQKSIGMIYGLCGGLLLGLISFGIVPEVIQLGDWMILLLGFLASVILFELLHSIFPSVSINESKTNFIRTGVLLTLSIRNIVMHSLFFRCTSPWFVSLCSTKFETYHLLKIKEDIMIIEIITCIKFISSKRGLNDVAET